MSIQNNIESRNETREKLIKSVAENCNDPDSAYIIKVFLLISQSIDDFIEQRITADKTIEGILKDIANNTDRIASQLD